MAFFSQCDAHKWKKLAYTLSIIAALTSAYYIYNKKTDGFRIYNITSEIPYRSDWEISTLSDSDHLLADSILNQKFYYLGRGGQCFAFQSGDGKYVLKLFRHERLYPPRWMEYAPPIWPLEQLKEEKTKLKKIKLDYTFWSFKLAFENLKEESGLIYAHFNKSNRFQKKVSITDKIGRSYLIDIDSVEFMLQKKADLILPTLKTYIQNNQIEEAKQALTHLIDMRISCCMKGIRDTDPSLRTNSGFIGTQAILIDGGRLLLDESMKKKECYKIEIQKMTKPLIEWLRERSIELSNHLEKIVEGL